MQHRCLCPCHSESRADQRECNQAGRFMEAYQHAQKASIAEYKGLGASVTDPVEAAVACPFCLDAHCPALSSQQPRGPKIVRITPPFNPTSDSQQPSSTDGNIDSEGPE